ncbi:hypothetical protein Oweho_0311 [Owenweeksia hongkongensis DSM 17368]|uniref:Uncharacterized protein n=2 Tax=Owenweeksia TaxID=267986 RepID=G8R809_OWEHD|nr:hypothetical protein Oweho_0311 [Owenweeksia hongkongensis DSM 17368]
MTIWRSFKFWRFFILFVIAGTGVGLLVTVILKDSGALEVESLDEKYIYHFDTVRSHEYVTVMVSDNLARAKEVTDFYLGRSSQIIGGDNLSYIKSFVKVKVMEYSADSNFVKIYAKYRFGVGPKIKIIEGFVPVYTLHNKLP